MEDPVKPELTVEAGKPVTTPEGVVLTVKSGGGRRRRSMRGGEGEEMKVEVEVTNTPADATNAPTRSYTGALKTYANALKEQTILAVQKGIESGWVGYAASGAVAAYAVYRAEQYNAAASAMTCSSTAGAAAQGLKLMGYTGPADVCDTARDLAASVAANVGLLKIGAIGLAIGGKKLTIMLGNKLQSIIGVYVEQKVGEIEKQMPTESTSGKTRKGGRTRRRGPKKGGKSRKSRR